MADSRTSRYGGCVGEESRRGKAAPATLAALTAIVAVWVAEASTAQLPNRECWIIPGSRCNTPVGDCINKAPGTWCNRCNIPAWISQTCVWHPSEECAPDSSQSIYCGDKLRGVCDEMGWCIGNTWVGECVLFPCGAPT